MGEAWIDLDTIPKDSEIKVFTGTVIRIYDKSLFSKDGYYDYLLTFIHGNHDYLQMTCLAKGEEGNVVSILKLEPKSYHVSIAEVKRMNDGYDKVLINFSPTIEVL